MNVANKSWMMAVGVGYLALEDKAGNIRFEIGFHCPDVTWPIYSPNATIKYEEALGKQGLRFKIDHYPAQVSNELGLGNFGGYCQLYEFEQTKDGAYDTKPAFTYEFTRKNHLQWIAPPLVIPSQLHSPNANITTGLSPENPSTSQTLCDRRDKIQATVPPHLDTPPTITDVTVNAIITHNQTSATTPIPEELQHQLQDETLKVTTNGKIVKVETVEEDMDNDEDDSTNSDSIFTEYNFQNPNSPDDFNVEDHEDTSWPTYPDDNSNCANYVSQAAQFELLHQRLAHVSPEVMRETIKRVHGVKPCKPPDDLHQCDSCAIAKIHKLPSGPASMTLPSHNCQQVMMDFGFMATLEEEEVEGDTDNTPPPAPTHSRQTRAATRAATAASQRSTTRLKSAKTAMPPPSLQDIEHGTADPHPNPRLRTTMIGVDFDEAETTDNTSMAKLREKLVAIEGAHGY